MELEAARLIAAGICMGLGAIGSGIGEGHVGAAALQAIGRNPSISGKIIPNMIVAMAITESTAIYSLVISLIILFVI
ncbi:ATP synthase F0 subunit C [Candidatus Uhrbacteria bacterium]|jgi:F-type H+-transporting ATPase subunit c|nr:ATP synthase F0 subunit C [Candidatus Uhrbacteria bacterium]